MPDLQTLLERSAALHNHLCPRQVLGVQMGIYAGELLGLSLPQQDKRLYALVETDGCFADGVAVASGCWLGRRTLRLLDYGKVAATFYDSLTERAVRLAPRPEIRTRAVALQPEAQSHWHAQLIAYQQMSRPELFNAQACGIAAGYGRAHQPSRRARDLRGVRRGNFERARSAARRQNALPQLRRRDLLHGRLS
jgi:formylmethanofuran dehydrogenase subunit E